MEEIARDLIMYIVNFEKNILSGFYHIKKFLSECNDFPWVLHRRSWFFWDDFFKNQYRFQIASNNFQFYKNFQKILFETYQRSIANNQDFVICPQNSIEMNIVRVCYMQIKKRIEYKNIKSFGFLIGTNKDKKLYVELTNELDDFGNFINDIEQDVYTIDTDNDENNSPIDIWGHLL